MLLGEKLIAFRDSDGRVGVMDHRCPHRCASLFFGRNEEGGLRCVYHGWKFDVDGQVRRHAERAAAAGLQAEGPGQGLPALERDGLVWVYMGARAEAPPLPALRDPRRCPTAEINVGMIQRECNWLQALEGDIDTSHFGFLHGGHADPDAARRERAVLLHGHQPRAGVSTSPTPPGARCTPAIARPSAGTTYWRFAQFPVSVLDAAAARRVRQPRARRAPGCRSTTTTRCSSSSAWKRDSARERLPQPAYKDGTPIGGTGRGNYCCRTRPTGSAAGAWRRQRGQRLAHRPRGAAHQPDLHRHRRHPPAGPGDHREHGADRRPRVRASRRRRPDDHPHAAPAADGGARLARPGHRAARRRGRRRLSRRPQRLFRQRRPALLARGLRHAARRGAAPGPAPARAAE